MSDQSEKLALALQEKDPKSRREMLMEVRKAVDLELTLVPVECNFCKAVCRTDVGHAVIEADWGYGSPMDGETHTAFACESCYRALISTMSSMPRVRNHYLGEVVPTEELSRRVTISRLSDEMREDIARKVQAALEEARNNIPEPEPWESFWELLEGTGLPFPDISVEIMHILALACTLCGSLDKAELPPPAEVARNTLSSSLRALASGQKSSPPPGEILNWMGILPPGPEGKHQLCSTCGCNWSLGSFDETCKECGPGHMTAPCHQCEGRCGSVWHRAVTDSHDYGLSVFLGQCLEKGDG